jgi:hypothetical protein
MLCISVIFNGNGVSRMKKDDFVNNNLYSEFKKDAWM